MPDPDTDPNALTAACGFCGARQEEGRVLFSGRPRARTLGRPTPFVCSDCVQATEVDAGEHAGSGLCTFCGRNAPRALAEGAAVLCRECAKHCTHLVAALPAGTA